MKRLAINSAIVFMSLTVVGATVVRAQSSHRFDIDIPFQFVLSGRSFPAGNYRVEQIDPSKPNLVMLKNNRSGILRLVLMQQVEKENPSPEAFLVFTRREGRYYLFQVWTLGDKNGNQVPGAGGKERYQRSNNSLVTLKAKRI
jgi:hypothetical protein